MRTRHLATAPLAVITAVTLSYATMISTAPGYAEASHSDASWQRLGQDNNANEGVWWSINNGAFGHDIITVGDDVIFKIEMHKYLWGTHYDDLYKVWIDFDANNVFEEEEVVLQGSWYFNTDGDYKNGNVADPLVGANLSDYFYSGTINFADEGDFWLRARVTCNSSINYRWFGHEDGREDLSTLLPKFKPDGHLHQGEVEDWKLTVVRQVPEPGLLSLLGLGVLGLALVGRKKK